MTGMKEEAPLTAIEDYIEMDEEDENENEASKEHWNFLDVVETESRLRPSTYASKQVRGPLSGVHPQHGPDPFTQELGSRQNRHAETEVQASTNGQISMHQAKPVGSAKSMIQGTQHYSEADLQIRESNAQNTHIKGNSEKEHQHIEQRKEQRSHAEVGQSEHKKAQSRSAKPIQARKKPKLKARDLLPNFIRSVTSSSSIAERVQASLLIPQTPRVPSPHSSSDSDQPLVHKQHQPQLPTPPISQKPSTTVGSNEHEAIDLDNNTEAIERETPEQLTLTDCFARLTSGLDTAQHSIEATVGNMESEPLSEGMVARTVLHVRAENMLAKGPVAVPLSAINASEALFSTLMAERKMSDALHRSVSDMTATFPWPDRSLCIRKGRPEDWVYFCNTVRKGWEQEAHHFNGECHIDIMIHVDD